MLEALIGLAVGGVAGYAVCWTQHLATPQVLDQPPAPLPPSPEVVTPIDPVVWDQARNAQYNLRWARQMDEQEHDLRRRDEDRHANERGKLIKTIDALKARLGEAPYEGEPISMPPNEVIQILARLDKLEKPGDL
jgi:hypothetical protein